MKHHFADPRPRDGQGQFAGQDTGGLDPSSMNVAYDPNIIAARKRVLSQKAIAEVAAAGGKANKETTFSMKTIKHRIKELAGGYAMKEGDDETIYKEPGVKGHLKRNAATYISLPLAIPSMGISALVGKTVDGMRAGGNAVKTHIDGFNPKSMKLPKGTKARKGWAINGRLEDGAVNYVPFASIHQRVRELAAKYF